MLDGAIIKKNGVCKLHDVTLPLNTSINLEYSDPNIGTPLCLTIICGTPQSIISKRNKLYFKPWGGQITKTKSKKFGTYHLDMHTTI